MVEGLGFRLQDLGVTGQPHLHLPLSPSSHCDGYRSWQWSHGSGPEGKPVRERASERARASEREVAKNRVNGSGREREQPKTK